MAADIPISDAVVVADKRMYLAKRCKNTVVTEDVAPNCRLLRERPPPDGPHRGRLAHEPGHPFRDPLR